MGRSNNQTNNAITNGTAKKFPQDEERMATFFGDRSANMSMQVLIAREKYGKNPGHSINPEVQAAQGLILVKARWKVDQVHYCTEGCGKYFIEFDTMKAHVLFLHNKWLK